MKKSKPNSQKLLVVDKVGVVGEVSLVGKVGVVREVGLVGKVSVVDEVDEWQVLMNDENLYYN